MSSIPLYLDLGDASTAPPPCKPPAVRPSPSWPVARPPVPKPFMPAPAPRPTIPVLVPPVAVPRGPWRGDPVVKSEVMKPECPQCGAKRNIVIGAAGMGPKFEVWACSKAPHHCIQTWPRDRDGSLAPAGTNT